MLDSFLMLDTSFLILIFLCIGSGFSAAYLGVGGSIILVPLIPSIIGLSPFETLQISLLFIFVMSFVNSLIFLYQGLVMWSWFFPVAITGICFSFVSNLFVSSLSDFGIRFLLLSFLSLTLLLPLLLKKLEVLKNVKGAWFFGSLMGLCVGLTGLGGGFLMSPYLHETRKVPPHRVSATVCLTMFLTCSFALLAQVKTSSFPFHQSAFWWKCYFIMLGSSLIGLTIGSFVNKKDHHPDRRRIMLRFLALAMFSKVSFEFLF